MRTQTTATIFWKLYKDQLKHPVGESAQDSLRHSCILGLTAIDAALFTYWESSVLPDWGEFMSLINATLDSSEALDELCLKTKPYLKKSQLVATLRFLHNTGEAERFTPNFVDFSVYAVSRFSDQLWCANLAQNLVELHKYRNAALHTGREWNEEIGKKCLQLLEAVSGSLVNLGNNFAEAFCESSRESKVIPLRKVA